MSLSCIIVDDEQPAIDVLVSFLEETSFLDLKHSILDPLEVLPYLKNHPIDLCFLDIEMPEMSGVELAQAISSSTEIYTSPMIIFTTAYHQYAIKGFELQIIDYLLKPIPYPRFLQGAKKALETHQLLNIAKQQLNSEEDYILVKANYQTKKIFLSEILYVEGLKDYIKIYTKDGYTLTRQNLKTFHKKLPNDHFIRIHKSYIVSINKIDCFLKSAVLIGNQKLPIGEHYKTNTLERLTKK